MLEFDRFFSDYAAFCGQSRLRLAEVRFLREKRAVEDLMRLALVRGFEALNQFIGFGGEQLFYILYLPSGTLDKAPVEGVFLFLLGKAVGTNGVYYEMSFILLISCRDGFGLQLDWLGHDG